MQPAIHQLPELKVIGIGAPFISILSPNHTNALVIPELWSRFINRMGEIKNRVIHPGPGHAPSYGLCERLPAGAPKSDPAEMFYIAATGVTEISDVPEGMISRIIPAGPHAVFTHTGLLHTLGQTMHNIFAVWLPASGRTLRAAPEIEIYDHRFNPHSPDSQFDICIPVAG